MFTEKNLYSKISVSLFVLALSLFLTSFNCFPNDLKLCPKCSVTFVQPENSICSGWHFKIEPDMQITDENLTFELAQSASTWLKENIDNQGGLYKLGKLNRKKIIIGYALKSEYINASPEQKQVNLENYCVWLREEGFWYD